MAAYRLVLVRHGESAWNLENRFSGWYDADLSPAGQQEARRGGEALRDAGYEFDICFTSVQKRAIRTLWTVLDAIDQMWLPVIRTWRLNERHYGALTGLNKAETAAKHGEAQVKIWRRSYDIPPPPMQSDHPFYSTISKVRPVALCLLCWEAPKSHLRSLQRGLASSAKSPLSLAAARTVVCGAGWRWAEFVPLPPWGVEPLGIARTDSKRRGRYLC